MDVLMILVFVVVAMCCVYGCLQTRAEHEADDLCTTVCLPRASLNFNHVMCFCATDELGWKRSEER